MVAHLYGYIIAGLECLEFHIGREAETFVFVFSEPYQNPIVEDQSVLIAADSMLATVNGEVLKAVDI